MKFLTSVKTSLKILSFFCGLLRIYEPQDIPLKSRYLFAGNLSNWVVDWVHSRFWCFPIFFCFFSIYHRFKKMFWHSWQMRWLAYLLLTVSVATDLEAKIFCQNIKWYFQTSWKFSSTVCWRETFDSDVRVKPEVQCNEEALELYHQQ